MSKTIQPGDFIRMLRGAAAKIRANHDRLSKLDSAIGDGDHGIAMLRAMEAVERAIEEYSCAGPKEVLAKAGWAVMSAAGGSTGPLLGSFLMGLGAGLGEAVELDSPALAAVVQRGIGQMHSHSKAQAGDKTMMDALLPAAAALAGATAEMAPAELLTRAAEAAARGAESTKDMPAKFGRARHLGPRALGHADPGATSMALLLAGFAEGLAR